MTSDKDTQSKNFIKQVEQLENEGIVRNRQEIISALGWSKSYMSQVMNGTKVVPPHIYKKFNEVYNLKTMENKPTLLADEQVVRNLSESVKNLTQSNQANAENLKTMLRIIEANSGAPKVASLIDSPSFHSLLDVIAKVVVQEKKFHSVDEFRAFAMKEIALHSSETK